ncbi:energy transducer TonB [Pandoraea apista]|uniref:Energy transducer TonB n=1 Tax=Pandoraea apista TaxID=93218 RepID=A0ABX9ZHQ2_9BURK|nr:energy transducer TonB [Pandoraea apista]RRJ26267.1 energy transducer TonB [Pandoraea apista]RRJ72874.1 energy transducer TonB [Pandoraea apista]RSC97757.1 energy transducer TonB [Pandoraea apista]RSD08162.1 energy transducer TonB [Pandoraea apista]RSK74896.1 energy transducer TonB [Pandoraea apista]
MTGNPPLAGALVLAGVMCGLSFLGASGAVRAQAQTAPTQAPAGAGDRRYTFDIPAQPLDMALELFSTVSGRSALFSSALVAGRTASPVSGRYTALEALRRLVDGTGLAVETASSHDVTTFVLVPATGQALESEGRERDATARLAGYDALVQTEIWQAICTNARTAKSRYRALLRFRVAPDGRVVDVRVLSETGETPMGATLVDTLSRVRVSQPPSPDLPQPFAMLILPESNGGPVCRAGARPS